MLHDVLCHQVLSVRPSDGFALVHAGFIYKVVLNDLERAIPLLYTGLRSNDPGTSEGKFYFHLGDALQRLGETEKVG